MVHTFILSTYYVHDHSMQCPEDGVQGHKAVSLQILSSGTCFGRNVIHTSRRTLKM